MIYCSSYKCVCVCVCVEGISTVDIVSHGARAALGPFLYRQWGLAAAEMAVWDLGSMENVGLWFVQKDDCVNRGTFGFTADKLVKNKNP